MAACLGYLEELYQLGVTHGSWEAWEDGVAHGSREAEAAVANAWAEGYVAGVAESNPDLKRKKTGTEHCADSRAAAAEPGDYQSMGFGYGDYVGKGKAKGVGKAKPNIFTLAAMAAGLPPGDYIGKGKAKGVGKDYPPGFLDAAAMAAAFRSEQSAASASAESAPVDLSASAAESGQDE